MMEEAFLGILLSVLTLPLERAAQVHHLIPCRLIEQHEARLLPLTEYRDLAALVAGLEFRPGEIAQLSGAQAGPVEQDQDRMIARARLQCKHLCEKLLAHNPLSQRVL